MPDKRSGLDAAVRVLTSVLAGRGHYECHMPDGSIRHLSWDELHRDLKNGSPNVYRRVKYRWVSDASE